MKRIIVCIAPILIATTSIAQPTAEDVCSRIIDHGLNNIALSTNAEAFADRLYWRFCDEKYENMMDHKRTEFGVTIKSIPLNLGGEASSSSQKHAKFCGDHKITTDRRSDTAIYTAKLHDRAIDAWSNCVALTQRSLFIDFRVPQSQKYMDVTLKYTGPSPTSFTGVEAEGFTCKRSGQEIDASATFQLGPAEDHLRCERDYAELEVAGVTSNYYAASGVTIKTQAGNSAIEFVPMLEGPARSRFEQIDASIAGLHRSVGNLSLSLASWGQGESQANRIGAQQGGSNWGVTKCPAGQYMVGVEGWGAPRPTGYCVNCGWAMRAICRPINQPD